MTCPHFREVSRTSPGGSQKTCQGRPLEADGVPRWESDDVPSRPRQACPRLEQRYGRSAMGFRFQKRIRIFKGLTLTLRKSATS